MNDTPDQADNPDAGPFGKDPATAPQIDVEMSIIDTILDLDDYLSGEVRRAEKTARFATRPDLEADIQALEAQLEQITDELGRPIEGAEDASLGDGESGPVLALVERIEELRREYARSFRSVRLRQMPSDDWKAFYAKWIKPRKDGEDYPREMWDALIVECAIAPRFTAEKIKDFRAQAGDTAVQEIAVAALDVNTKSGVSIPKSPISSRARRRLEREKN